MKNCKIADFWISVVLIIGFVLFGFTTKGESIFYGYFIVGCWQVLSMVIHSANRWFMQKNDQRSNYHKFVFLFVAIISLLIGIEWFVEKTTSTPVLIASFMILYLTPFMAVFYTYLCYEETFIKMKRPMELLK